MILRKFRFRLATLLKLREATRDEKYARLAQAYEAEETLKEQKTALEEQRRELRQQFHEAAQPGVVNLDQLVESHRYEAVVMADEQVLVDQMKLIGEEIERRRGVLVEADREVRVLERLRETQQNRHREEAMRQEMKELDEVAGQLARRSETG